MPFEIQPDTIQTPHPHAPGIVVVSGPGGSPWLTDPAKPHLGGNFDGGDLGTMYPHDLWPWLISTFGVKTMVDVGCGIGETAAWFFDRDIEAVGIDGLEFNVSRCKTAAILHDFQDGPCVFAPVDLIWCADVAEHIEEKYVGNLIRTLTQCRVLAMCQGTDKHPDGWHHVNNQPEQYWVDLLAAAGMVEDVESTRASRAIAWGGWWKVSGRIYRRKAG